MNNLGTGNQVTRLEVRSQEEETRPQVSPLLCRMCCVQTTLALKAENWEVGRTLIGKAVSSEMRESRSPACAETGTEKHEYHA